MPCCGLCRTKRKPTIKNNKNITAKKIHTIDMWIENIKGPYESIILPSKPAEEPKILTNKEERLEIKTNESVTDISVDKINQYGSTKKAQKNIHYILSELSLQEETQSAMS